MTSVDHAMSLDLSGEPWVGTFRGLGTVRIHEDGAVSVEVDVQASDDPRAVEAALRFGWAEGLSFARRGFTALAGAAVCPPSGSPVCIVLIGEPFDVGGLLVELVQRAWTVLSDRWTPTRWEGGSLVAHPRAAPVLLAVGQVDAHGLEGRRVRANSNTRAVDLPRAHEPAVIAGLVNVTVRRAGEQRLGVLSGQERFEAAAESLVGGALRRVVDSDGDGVEQAPDFSALAQESMGELLKFATLPSCYLRLDVETLTQDADALVEWFETSAIPPQDRA